MKWEEIRRLANGSKMLFDKQRSSINPLACFPLTSFEASLEYSGFFLRLARNVEELTPDGGSVAVAEDAEELVVLEAALDELLLGNPPVAVLIEMGDHPPCSGLLLRKKCRQWSQGPRWKV